MTSPQSPADIALRIKARAQDLGFDACGIAKAQAVAPDAVERYDRWIASGSNDCMHWAERHRELRNDPRLLLEGAKSVIVLAMNYYPQVVRPDDAPQFAYYAYGDDYHDVLRHKARELCGFIRDIASDAKFRVCVDSAPIRERYWARMAGIGFIGLNNMLIIPGKGSFFFLCEILTTLDLPADSPCDNSCGECRACLAACPTHAITDDRTVDARRCLSCQTIENHDEQLPKDVVDAMGNRVYGCDECQLVCPHNRHAKPTSEPAFQPSEAFLRLSREHLLNLTPHEFNAIFGRSAVKRTKLSGLIRNAKSIR